MNLTEKINRMIGVTYSVIMYDSRNHVMNGAPYLKSWGFKVTYNGTGMLVQFDSWKSALKFVKEYNNGSWFEYYEIVRNVNGKWDWSTGYIKYGEYSRKPKRRVFSRNAIVIVALMMLSTLASAQVQQEECKYLPQSLSEIHGNYANQDDRPVAKLAHAFAMVESGDAEDAVNGICVGWLQITPVMVREANRILGWECFFLEDREDQQGSLAIFVTVMREKNPELSVRKACEIWNPRAGSDYYERVKNCYEMILTGDML
jgi:hypothetical protein